MNYEVLKWLPWVSDCGQRFYFLNFLFAFLFILKSVPIVPSAVRATLFSVKYPNLTGHESSNSLLG